MRTKHMRLTPQTGTPSEKGKIATRKRNVMAAPLDEFLDEKMLLHCHLFSECKSPMKKSFEFYYDVCQNRDAADFSRASLSCFVPKEG